jgi:hypothetical protein
MAIGLVVVTFEPVSEESLEDEPLVGRGPVAPGLPLIIAKVIPVQESAPIPELGIRGVVKIEAPRDQLAGEFLGPPPVRMQGKSARDLGRCARLQMHPQESRDLGDASRRVDHELVVALTEDSRPGAPESIVQQELMKHPLT